MEVLFIDEIYKEKKKEFGLMPTSLLSRTQFFVRLILCTPFNSMDSSLMDISNHGLYASDLSYAQPFYGFISPTWNTG